MALYKIQNFTSGKWVDKKEVLAKGVTSAKIVSETEPEPSQWKDDDGNIQMQDVCKIKFEGMGDDAFKFSLNKIVINGLVQAFGQDSREWIGKPLTVEAEKTRVAGKAGVAVYLIPEGYARIDDEEGYAKIVKKESESDGEIPVIEEGNVDIKDITF